MNTRNNKKVQATKKKLKLTLLTLLQEKSVDKITISELCHKAEINRGTFYKHYSDVDNLLKSIEDDSFNRVLQFLSDNQGQENLALFQTMVKKIYENAVEYNLLFAMQIYSDFSSKIIKEVTNRMVNSWKKTYSKRSEFQLQQMACFVGMGTIGVLGNWVQSGMKESQETVARLLNAFIAPYHVKL